MIHRADGGCRHISASLFDLLNTHIANEFHSSTSKDCVWVKKGKRNEGCLPVTELKISRPEYGKKMKTHVQISEFLPESIDFNAQDLKLQFREALILTVVILLLYHIYQS